MAYCDAKYQKLSPTHLFAAIFLKWQFEKKNEADRTYQDFGNFSLLKSNQTCFEFTIVQLLRNMIISPELKYLLITERLGWQTEKMLGALFYLPFPDCCDAFVCE